MWLNHHALVCCMHEQMTTAGLQGVSWPQGCNCLPDAFPAALQIQLRRRRWPGTSSSHTAAAPVPATGCAAAGGIPTGAGPRGEQPADMRYPELELFSSHQRAALRSSEYMLDRRGIGAPSCSYASGARGVLQAARELVAAWGFLHTFGELLGVWPASLTELLAALVDGACSRLTAELHIGLLRLLQVPRLVHQCTTARKAVCCMPFPTTSCTTRSIGSATSSSPSLLGVQADMEEAYLTNSATVATGFTDRAATACATTLDEAWAWGFDVDAWRAHLGPATWPEVLRQFAVAAGEDPVSACSPAPDPHIYAQLPPCRVFLSGQGDQAASALCSHHEPTLQGGASSGLGCGPRPRPRWARRARTSWPAAPRMATCRCACRRATTRPASRAPPGR